MKSFIPYSFLLAAAACGVAYGQTTAYTVPVGYVTLTASATADTDISIPMQRAVEWAGISTGITGNTISVAASSFTAHQFEYSMGVQPKTYLVQVKSGALAGREFKVLSNNASGVTVDPVGATTVSAQGFISGDSITIRPYWTLATLFPSGAGFVATSDITLTPSALYVTDNAVTATNRSSTATYAYSDGTDTGTAGWYDANSYVLSNDQPLYSNNVYSAHNETAFNKSLVISGSVPSIATTQLIVSDTQPNDNNLQLSYPVNTTLDQSMLFQSGAFTATADITLPVDTLYVFDSTTPTFNPSSSAAYTYDTGADLGTPGWYNVNDYTAAGALPVLKAGSIIIIQKGTGASLIAQPWTAPLPYSL